MKNKRWKKNSWKCFRFGGAFHFQFRFGQKFSSQTLLQTWLTLSETSQKTFSIRNIVSIVHEILEGFQWESKEISISESFPSENIVAHVYIVSLFTQSSTRK